MAKKIKTRPVTMIQVREYLAKAEEFLLAATSELEAERSISATSLAIHAGINAADVVCGARRKERAAGQDHREVITLLRRSGDDGLSGNGLFLGYETHPDDQIRRFDISIDQDLLLDTPGDNSHGWPAVDDQGRVYYTICDWTQPYPYPCTVYRSR